MIKLTLDKIVIDREIADLMPEMPEDDYHQLEKSLVMSGKLDAPLVVWKGTNILIWGFHRYKILIAHPEIRYNVREEEFENKGDVIIWIYRQLMARKITLTPQRQELFIGMAYNAKKRPGGRKRKNQQTTCTPKKVPEPNKVFRGNGKSKQDVVNWWTKFHSDWEITVTLRYKHKKKFSPFM